MAKVTKQLLLETARQHALGLSNKEIAHNLDVCDTTIRTYLKRAEELGYVALAEDERKVVYEAMWEGRRGVAEKALRVITKRLDIILNKAPEDVGPGDLEEAIKALEITEHVVRNQTPQTAVQVNALITTEAIDKANKASKLIAGGQGGKTSN